MNMKRITVICAALLLFSSLVSAQGDFEPWLLDAIRQDPLKAASNLNPYMHGDLHDTPPPPGYKPFYISHYGRHGSRHSWGGQYYRLIGDVLGKADSLGILTPEGRAIIPEARQLDSTWNGMDGRLSQKGVLEHREIAQRMVRRFPAVFKGTPRVRAVSSTVQRCIISMDAFTTGVTALRPKTEWYLDTGERFMDYISETGHADKALRKRSRLIPDNIFDQPCDSTWILDKLFTDTAAGRALIPSLNRFSKALFRSGSISKCWDIEDHMLSVLQPEYLYRYYSYDCHYYVTGYGYCTEAGTSRLDSLSLLINDVVSKADEAIAGGRYCADLRFGHDFPLLTLISYLGIEGPGSKLDFDKIDAQWPGWENLCMASNLQMVFYRNRAGRVLVKFLYQEQERTLHSLPSVSGPYYDWDVVKANIRGYKR